MNGGYVFLIVAVAAVVGLLAFRLFQNKKAEEALTVSTCGDVAYRGGTLDPNAWYNGPPLSAAQGGTKSPGMPLHPAPRANGQPGYEIVPPIDKLPRALGQGDKFDSTAFKHGPLMGMSQIHMILEAEYTDGAELLAVPEENPANHFLARITIYFQEEGDPWTGADQYEGFRWYYDVDIYVKPGVTEIIAPLNSLSWGATQFSTNNPADKGGTDANGNRLPEYNPTAFQAAKAKCCCVGWGLGGDEIGRIHGAFATAPIKLTVTKFEVS